MAGSKTVTLVLGGARSGKTSHAMHVAEAAADARVYVATAQPLDDEMAARIERHREERGPGWRTVEEPLNLSAVLSAIDAPEVVLVDCLTLWLSNLIHYGRDVEEETAALITALDRHHAPVVLVSNEVGLSIVPENALARQFRDLQGKLNQQVAAAADRVVFVAAGLPLVLKD